MMIVRPMIVRPMMVVRLSGHPLIRDSLSVRMSFGVPDEIMDMTRSLEMVEGKD